MVTGMIESTRFARAALAVDFHDHIVDRLIAERAPKLAASVPWPVLRPLLYGILDYGKARRMADAIAPLSGRDALAYVSALLQVRVTVRGLEHVPPLGRLVMICNHPTGIADGVAVHDAIDGVRPDTDVLRQFRRSPRGPAIRRGADPPSNGSRISGPGNGRG